MRDYVIEVGRIEELQTLNDRHELENILSRANSAIVNGAKTLLVRKDKTGRTEKFDEMSTQEELDQFKERILKYLR